MIPAGFNAAQIISCDAGSMGLRCLIVDDNPEFIDAARSLLEREGVTVVGVASTSAEATRRVAELRPDVTLVDVNLGEESGLDLACTLTAETGRASSQVILISTYAAEDVIDANPTRPSIKFLSKADLSGRAIRSALGLPTQGDVTR